jgi:hypothetical protein
LALCLGVSAGGDEEKRRRYDVRVMVSGCGASLTVLNVRYPEALTRPSFTTTTLPLAPMPAPPQHSRQARREYTEQHNDDDTRAATRGCLAVLGSFPHGAGSGSGTTMGPDNERCPLDATSPSAPGAADGGT